MFTAGVLTIISKGKFDFLLILNLQLETYGWLGAAIGWAVYSIYLLNWKIKSLVLMGRFTLIAFLDLSHFSHFLF